MTPDSEFRRKARRRVLVVEDEPPVMQFLEALLTQAGCDVIQARNGVEAMVALTTSRRDLPHAILLDLGLPLEDGISVLSFLRNVIRSGIPESADQKERRGPRNQHRPSVITDSG